MVDKIDTYVFKEVDVFNKDFDTYCRAHNNIFDKHKVSQSWFRWYHNKLYSNIRTYGVYDNDSLIGIWSVEPHAFLYNKKLIKVGRCFAVGIKENYRNKGVFTKLSRYALKQEKLKNEFDYIFGFPLHGNVVLFGHLKVGWYRVFNIPIYHLYRKDAKTTTLPSVIEKIGYSDDPVSHNIEGSFINNRVEERFLKHPENAYIELHTLSTLPTLNCNKGYIIMKPYNSWCHILDIIGNPAENIEIAKNMLHGNMWEYITIWCADNEVYKKHIIEAGFKSSEHRYRTMIAYNIKAEKDINLETCHIQNWIEEMF